MSSINEALRRARQMDESSSQAAPSGPPGQSSLSFTQKRRSRTPFAGVLIIVVFLAGIIGWFILTPGETETPKAKKTQPSSVIKITDTASSSGSDRLKARAELPRALQKDQPTKQVRPHRTTALSKKIPQASNSAGKPIEITPKKPQMLSKKASQAQKAPPRHTAPGKKVISNNIQPKASSAPTLTKPAKLESSPKPIRDAAAALKHFYFGREAQKRGRYSEAVSEYRQALRLNPQLTQAYLNLGNIFFFHDKTQDKAQEMYTRVLKIDPNDKLGHNNIGVIFLRRNLFDQAEAEFTAALKLDPAFADASYNLACLYAKKGQRLKALARLLKAAQINPAVRRWAAGDTDFQSLADLPEFERFLRQAGPDKHKAIKQ
ncbi:MAG: tetratricopeptide repeat protein [Deltaproteobacteria bacterium]|nr:tetratricopeptide repeat protein [Deltaproteobacteria bacterium]MBW2052588.1 tetratricopeptide repeat protein [Deltaproteobacteria bacterium]MBW2141703.1 tetratricopeptide repeat protein [Deltaproteobacteria bacterium]MBW2323178.1 tetratricopeptide repeat protein [Deltaproteobacteria bacterium]